MSGVCDTFCGYSMTQLHDMLEDDDKLSQMVLDMDEVQDVQRSKEQTLRSNRTLAEQNLALQPKLEHQKEQLTKHYSRLQEHFESYQLRKSTLDHKSGNTSLDTLLALLQAEGAKIEEDTENMADCFLDGDMTLDSFVDSYQSQRKLAHLRRVKIEKLQEMLLMGQRLPQAPVAAARSQDAAFPPPRAPVAAPRSQDAAFPPPRAPVAAPRSQDAAVPSSPPQDDDSPLAPARRKPPSQPAPVLSQPPPPSPYPPIPPRTGQPFPSVQGYPFLPQYAPPQRAAPQTGFIMQ